MAVITLHWKFGFKQIIDICHALGFSASYQEARWYEISAALQGKISLSHNCFIQFVHDNADSNIATLDGKGTFLAWGQFKLLHHQKELNLENPSHDYKQFQKQM